MAKSKSKEEQVLTLVRKLGVIRPRDLNCAGYPVNTSDAFTSKGSSNVRDADCTSLRIPDRRRITASPRRQNGFPRESFVSSRHSDSIV